jgi:hypothetical protein
VHHRAGPQRHPVASVLIRAKIRATTYDIAIGDTYQVRECRRHGVQTSRRPKYVASHCLAPTTQSSVQHPSTWSNCHR